MKLRLSDFYLYEPIIDFFCCCKVNQDPIPVLPRMKSDDQCAKTRLNLFFHFVNFFQPIRIEKCSIWPVHFSYRERFCAEKCDTSHSKRLVCDRLVVGTWKRLAPYHLSIPFHSSIWPSEVFARGRVSTMTRIQRSNSVPSPQDEQGTKAALILEDGTSVEGLSFGAEKSVGGEVGKVKYVTCAV